MDAQMSRQDRESWIAALLRERRAYTIHGDKDGVKAVDAALKRLGYEAAPPEKRAETRPASPRTEKR